jgi:hypothetical protein
MRVHQGAALLAGLIAISTPAAAFPPSPVTSKVPCGITLVATHANGAPDPAGMFTIVVHDIADTPEPLAPVKLYFSGCSDVAICSVQTDAAATVSCGPDGPIISTVADEDGVVRLTLIGGVAHRSSPSSSGCVKVIAEGTLLTDGTNKPLIQVSALDESGGDGLTTADLSLWLDDYFSNANPPRSDFDYSATCSPNVGSSDLARWLTSYFSNYVVGCNSRPGSLCP